MQNTVRILKAPGDLTLLEWDSVLSAVAGGGPLSFALLKLKDAKNEPQKASDLFHDPKLMNQNGPEYINNRLRSANLPFRLHRVGRWTSYRPDRKLALVPWASSND